MGKLRRFYKCMDMKDDAAENKMVEELVDMEYISLHGCIRNIPSDTEVHAEHHLRVDRST